MNLVSTCDDLESVPVPTVKRDRLRDSTFACFLLLGIAIVVGAYRDAQLLFRYDVGVGQDGYYDVIQAKSLGQNGHLYLQGWSPGFPYAIAGISRLTGDYVRTIKGLSVGLECLLCLGIFALIRLLTGSNWFGLLGAVVCQLSAQHLYYVAEFNSALFSITLLLWGGILLFIGLNSPSRLKWACRIAGVIFLILACASNIFTLLLVIGLALCDAAFQLIVYCGKSSRAYFALPAVLIVWLIPLAIARLPVKSIPRGLIESVSKHPQWPLSSFDWPQTLLLAIASVLLLSAAVKGEAISQKNGKWLWNAGAMFSLLFLLNPFWDFRPLAANSGAAIGNSSGLILALVLTGLLWQRDFARGKRWTAAMLLPILAVLGVMVFKNLTPLGVRDNYLVDRIQLIESLRLREANIPKQGFIVAPVDDSFVITDTLNISSRPEMPSDVAPENVLWLLRRVPSSMADSSIILLAAQGDYATVLIPDRILRAKLSHTKTSLRVMLQRFNPYLSQIDSSQSAARPHR